MNSREHRQIPHFVGPTTQNQTLLSFQGYKTDKRKSKANKILTWEAGASENVWWQSCFINDLVCETLQPCKEEKKETNICFSELTTAVTRSETSHRTMEVLPWLHLFHSVALSSWTSREWSSASWTRMDGTIYEPTPLSLTHVIAAAKGRKLSVMFPSQMIGAGVNKYLCWFYPFPLNTRSRCLTLWCIFFCPARIRILVLVW